jgi:hypothetical protein
MLMKSIDLSGVADGLGAGAILCHRSEASMP